MVRSALIPSKHTVIMQDLFGWLCVLGAKRLNLSGGEIIAGEFTKIKLCVKPHVSSM